MGLALVTDVREGPGGPVLEVDLGTNRHVRYAVGTGARRASTGPGGWIEFDELTGVSFESPIRPSPGNHAFRTTVVLELDPTRLDREHRAVQVTSYRSADGAGPAWSRVVDVGPSLAAGRVDGDGLPEFRRPAMSDALLAAAASARSVPMTVRESSMSAAMDWGALLGLVDDLAPLAEQVLELAADEQVQAGASGLMKILGPLFESAMGGAGALMGGLGAGATGGEPAGGAAAPSPVPGRPSPVASTCPPGSVLVCLPRPTVGATEAPRPPAATAQSVRPGRARAMDGGAISIPAVLGIVSAVAPTVMKMIQPLVEQSPAMFQAYLDHPLKMLDAIAEIERQDQQLVNAQVDRLLDQGNRQLLLTMLQGMGQGGGANPATPAALAGLVASGAARPGGSAPGPAVPSPSTMSLRRPLRSGGASGRAPSTRASRALRAAGSAERLRDGAERPGSVDERIDAVLVPPDPIDRVATPRAMYGVGRPLTFSLVLSTAQAPPGRPIPHVVARVRIRDAAKRELLLERRVEVGAVHLNQEVAVTLDASATAGLPVGRDLTASIDVSWTGTDGRTHTTPRRAVQQLSLVDGAFVAGPGRRTGDEVALSDPHRHRAFWHRIWEGGSSTHSRWELDVSARYYYVLAVEESANARMETKLRVVDDRSEDTGHRIVWGGLLKSGMELSVDVLNLLLDELGGPDDRPWSPGDLDALRSDLVVRSAATKAGLELHLRGRTEERGAVWVFPAISLVEFELHRPDGFDGRGAVVSTTRETRRFPLPTAAVVVGMETEG